MASLAGGRFGHPTIRSSTAHIPIVRLASAGLVSALLFACGAGAAIAACQTTTQVVAPGATFNNSGCIATTSSDAVAAGAGSTVNNAPSGDISQTGGNPTSAVHATGNSFTLNNSGSISGIVVGQDSTVLITGDAAAITNAAGGTINIKAPFESTAIFISGSSSLVTNNGTISSTSTGAIGNFGVQVFGPSNNTVINNGVILRRADRQQRPGPCRKRKVQLEILRHDRSVFRPWKDTQLQI